jgi:hypothetical protein
VFALYLTFTIAVYLLGPDLLSRFILGFVCPRRYMVQTKSEELTRAIAWAVFPLAAASFTAWKYGNLRKFAGWADWKIFFAGLYSEGYFERHQDQFFHAARNVCWSNICILWRLYLIVLVFWFAVDILILNYGRIRHSGFASRHPIVNRSLKLFVMPRVSEWHVYLSTMLTPQKDVVVMADVLTKGNAFYDGRVVDKMLTSDGGLATLTLGDPRRFRREEYLAAKAKGEESTQPNKADYWARIPGKTFIIMAAEISTVNLRHSSQSSVIRDQRILDLLRKAMKDYERNLGSEEG